MGTEAPGDLQRRTDADESTILALILGVAAPSSITKQRCCYCLEWGLCPRSRRRFDPGQASVRPKGESAVAARPCAIPCQTILASNFKAAIYFHFVFVILAFRALCICSFRKPSEPASQERNTHQGLAQRMKILLLPPFITALYTLTLFPFSFHRRVFPFPPSLSHHSLFALSTTA